MGDKTTIQLSEQTKAELDNLKNGDLESYDAVVQRLVRHENEDRGSGGLTEQEREEVREIVREMSQRHRQPDTET